MHRRKISLLPLCVLLAMALAGCKTIKEITRDMAVCDF